MITRTDMNGRWIVAADPNGGGYVLEEHTPAWVRTHTHVFFSKIMAQMYANRLNRNRALRLRCSGDF